MYLIRLILKLHDIKHIIINDKVFVYVKGGCVIIYSDFTTRYISNSVYEKTNY